MAMKTFFKMCEKDQLKPHKQKEWVVMISKDLRQKNFTILPNSTLFPMTSGRDHAKLLSNINDKLSPGLSFTLFIDITECSFCGCRILMFLKLTMNMSLLIGRSKAFKLSEGGCISVTE